MLTLLFAHCNILYCSEQSEHIKLLLQFQERIRFVILSGNHTFGCYSSCGSLAMPPLTTSLSAHNVCTKQMLGLRSSTNISGATNGSDELETSWQANRTLVQCNRQMLRCHIACDVTFSVGQTEETAEEISAHKYMLMSRSPVFYAMFCGQMSEAASDNGTIRVPDVEPDAFRHMLELVGVHLLLRPCFYLGSSHEVLILHLLRSCASSPRTPDSFMVFVNNIASFQFWSTYLSVHTDSLPSFMLSLLLFVCFLSRINHLSFTSVF